jgi:hypothetical protein
MCSADGTTEVPFEVLEESPAVALRSDFPDQLVELRNNRLGQTLLSGTPFKT